MNATDAVPFFNEAAERAVLGALLLDNKVMHTLPSTIRAEDFYRPKHAALFRIFADMIGTGKLADLLTISELPAGACDTAGGVAYLAQLTESYISVRDVEHHARIVIDLANRRRAVGAYAEALRILQDNSLSPSDAQSRAESVVATIANRSANVRVREADLVSSVFKRADASYDKDETRAIRTGLPSIDAELRITKQDVVVVAAYSGGGKSMLMSQIARVNCVGPHARPGLVANLEMSEIEMVERRFMDMGSLTLDDVIKPRSNGAADRMVRAGDVISKTSRVEYFQAFDIDAIFREAVRMKRELGDLAFLEIDYLQILDFNRESGDTRDAQIGAVTRKAKRFAAEHEVPVIFGSQLRRPERGSKKPTKDDLRESGNIANDANAVLILWTPGLIDGTPQAKAKDLRTVHALIAKQRRGPANKQVSICQVFEHARFAEIEKPEEAEPEATEAA